MGYRCEMELHLVSYGCSDGVWRVLEETALSNHDGMDGC